MAVSVRAMAVLGLVAAASSMYIEPEHRTIPTNAVASPGPVKFTRLPPDTPPAGKISEFWLCDKCGGRQETEPAMDEHLVNCEAICANDSWGFDGSSGSSLDITDGVEEVDESGWGPASDGTPRERDWFPQWNNDLVPEMECFVRPLALPGGRAKNGGVCRVTRPRARTQTVVASGFGKVGAVQLQKWGRRGAAARGGMLWARPPLLVGLGLRPIAESQHRTVLPSPILRRRQVQVTSSKGASAEGGGDAQGGSFDQVMDVVDVAFTEVLGEEERAVQGGKLGILARGKNMLLRAVRSRGDDKGFLAKHGVSALISYGFVSHITYGACIAIAWVATGLRSGLSPFAPGQWTPFFAAYLALCASVFWLRPFRIALSLFLAPKVDSVASRASIKMGVKKGLAMWGVAGFLNVVVPLVWLHGGIFAACTLASAPYMPARELGYPASVRAMAVAGAILGQFCAGPMGSIAGIMWLFDFRWWRVLLAVVVG